MKPFEHITERIYTRLRKEGVFKFSLDEIREIIGERNFLLDLYTMDMFDWERIDRKNKDELDYRKNMYVFIKEFCDEKKISVTDADFDRIFRLERDIVPHYRVNYYDEKFIFFDDRGTVSFTEMDFKKEFRIYKWMNWKRSIDRAVNKFFREFEILPNRLYANKHTLSQFNFLINSVPGEKDDVFRYDEVAMMKIPVDDEEIIELSGYESGDCTLHFWFDQRIKAKKFLLDYNDDQVWGIDDDDDDDDDNEDDILLPPPPPGSSRKLLVTIP